MELFIAHFSGAKYEIMTLSTIQHVLFIVRLIFPLLPVLAFLPQLANRPYVTLSLGVLALIPSTLDLVEQRVD